MQSTIVGFKVDKTDFFVVYHSPCGHVRLGGDHIQYGWCRLLGDGGDGSGCLVGLVLLLVLLLRLEGLSSRFTARVFSRVRAVAAAAAAAATATKDQLRLKC